MANGVQRAPNGSGVNDFALKPLFHNAVTGKLSDFAGLFALTLFVATLWPQHRRLAACVIAVSFTFWKTTYAEPLIEAWNAVAPFAFGRTVDLTDLVALPMIPLADLVDVMLAVKAQAYLFEAANARHEHEYTLWQSVKLPPGKILAPGVVTHATTIVEHPELVSQRIQRFARLVGRENVVASTDCGLGLRCHAQIAWAKLAALSEGAALASKVSCRARSAAPGATWRTRLACSPASNPCTTPFASARRPTGSPPTRVCSGPSSSRSCRCARASSTCRAWRAGSRLATPAAGRRRATRASPSCRSATTTAWTGAWVTAERSS